MEKSKIQKFVEGLANSELTDSQQSVVLSTDAESIGAGDNTGCKIHTQMRVKEKIPNARIMGPHAWKAPIQTAKISPIPAI